MNGLTTVQTIIAFILLFIFVLLIVICAQCKCQYCYILKIEDSHLALVKVRRTMSTDFDYIVEEQDPKIKEEKTQTNTCHSTHKKDDEKLDECLERMELEITQQYSSVLTKSPTTKPLIRLIPMDILSDDGTPIPKKIYNIGIKIDSKPYECGSSVTSSSISGIDDSFRSHGKVSLPDIEGSTTSLQDQEESRNDLEGQTDAQVKVAYNAIKKYQLANSVVQLQGNSKS